MRFPIKKIAALSAVVSGLLAASATAGVVERLQAFRHHSWLHLNLDARDLLDEKTASTVDSGLPGTCLYDVVLIDEKGKKLAQRFLEWTLQFDLWENHYRVQTLEGVLTFATLAEADSAWSRIRAVRLFPLKEMHADRKYRLQVEITVQPLGAEEKARISRYVSQNSSSDRSEFSLDVGGLFRRLLGDTAEADPQSRFESAWFKINDLEEAP